MKSSQEFEFVERGGRTVLVLLNGERIGDINQLESGNWCYFNGKVSENYQTREHGPEFETLEACKASLSVEN